MWTDLCMPTNSGSQSQPVGFHDSSAAVVMLLFLFKINVLSPRRTNNLCEPDHTRPLCFIILRKDFLPAFQE